jgi:hypothetical protein
MGELTLPRRAGGAPRTTTTNPQQQLDQIPDLAEYQTMREIVTGWTNVIHRPSLRAPRALSGCFYLTTMHGAQKRRSCSAPSSPTYIHSLTAACTWCCRQKSMMQRSRKVGACHIRWRACRPFRPNSDLRSARRRGTRGRHQPYPQRGNLCPRRLTGVMQHIHAYAAGPLGLTCSLPRAVSRRMPGDRQRSTRIRAPYRPRSAAGRTNESRRISLRPAP